MGMVVTVPVTMSGNRADLRAFEHFLRAVAAAAATRRHAELALQLTEAIATGAGVLLDLSIRYATAHTDNHWKWLLANYTLKTRS